MFFDLSVMTMKNQTDSSNKVSPTDTFFAEIWKYYSHPNGYYGLKVLNFRAELSP